MTPLELKTKMRASCTENELSEKVCRYLKIMYGHCNKCGGTYVPKSRKQ